MFCKPKNANAGLTRPEFEFSAAKMQSQVCVQGPRTAFWRHLGKELFQPPNAILTEIMFVTDDATI